MSRPITGRKPALTLEQAQTMVYAVRHGMKATHAAKLYNVAESTVRRYVRDCCAHYKGLCA